jgi:hypothetical protein
MIARELLYVVVVPGVAATVTALACRWWRILPQVQWAAGVGLGYFVGQLGLKSRAGLARAFWSFAAPNEAVDWLPHSVLLVLGVTVFATYAPRAWRRPAYALAAMATIAAPLRLLAGSVYVAAEWSVLERVTHLVLLSATLGLVWLLLAIAHDDDQPLLRAALLVVVAAGSAATIALSASFAGAELCGVVATVLTGSWIVCTARGLSGAAGVVTMSLGSLIVLGHYYAELTLANAALLLIALIFAAGRLPHAVSTRQPWQQAAARAGLCLVPLAIALVGALVAAQSGISPDPYAILGTNSLSLSPSGRGPGVRVPLDRFC